MALITVNHHSKVLEKHHSFQVILPEEDTHYQKGAEVTQLKSILLLHGLSNDETIYTRYTNIERCANDAHIAVIIPSVGKSFYTNMTHGQKFYDYIFEVHDYAHQILPLSREREDNFVAGHSMGGYGTLKMAFTAGERFGKACSMSAVTDFQHMLDYSWFDFPKSAIVGDLKNVEGTLFDIAYLAENAFKEKKEIPKLYMMCGTEDVLYPDNLAFKEFLEAQKVPLKFEDGSGDHNWDYWSQGIEKAIAWFAK